MALFGGNDAQLITNYSVYGQMHELIKDAKKKLTVVSPYILEPPDAFLREMLAAVDRGVEVLLVFRRDKLVEYRGLPWFRRLQEGKVALATIERLHAKVYANERRAILTSMNFSSDSAERSIEVGIVFDDTHTLWGQLEGYLQELCLPRSLELVSSSAHAKNSTKSHAKHSSSATAATGHCLRCGTWIPLNEERPFCPADYEKWAKYENWDFEEKHCHRCGKAAPTSRSKPLCYDCFTHKQ